MLIIHPIWEIDENARILRVEAWFSPRMAPVSAEISARDTTIS